ncbi:MAG: hypothetical protein ACI9E4_000226 [Pseudohongiellaceae bacterium]|jgi:hypothetical protein
MLKALYVDVDVAVADLQHGIQHRSASWINLLTGIHRETLSVCEINPKATLEAQSLNH